MFTLRKSHLRAFLGAFMAGLQVLSATAGTIQFSQGGLNARTSLNFKGHGNVLTTIPKGTTGDVLDRWELPSGNFGIKLKITKLGGAKTSLSEGQEIWVYYHRDSTNRIVELLDDDGKKTENPARGAWAVALSTFKTQKSEPKKEPVCSDCQVNEEPQVAAEPITNMQVETAAQIVDATSDAPVTDFAVEEVLAYINQVRKGQNDANRVIAQSLIDECKTQDVPLSLALGLMQAENQFTTHTSPKGALGLMQVMPNTALEMFGLNKNQIAKLTKTQRAEYLRQAKEPALNIKFGVATLAQDLKRYGGDQDLAIAAYNAGSGRVSQHLKTGRELPRETRRHIAKVSRYKNNYLAFEKTAEISLSVASNN